MPNRLLPLAALLAFAVAALGASPLAAAPAGAGQLLDRPAQAETQPDTDVQEGEHTFKFAVPGGPCGKGRTGGWLENGVAVVPSSPAAAAGIRDGDEIVSIDGVAVGPDNPLADVVQSHAPGDRVRVEVRRAGEEDTATVTVTLGERSDDAAKAFLGVAQAPMARAHRLPFDGNGSFDFPGVTVEQGTFVASVADDSPAAAAGLEPGTVITAIDGETLEGPVDLKTAIEGRTPGDTVRLTVRAPEADEESDVTVELGAHPQDSSRAYLGVAIGIATRMMLPSGDSLQLPEPARILPLDPSELRGGRFEFRERPVRAPYGGDRA